MDTILHDRWFTKSWIEFRGRETHKTLNSETDGTGDLTSTHRIIYFPVLAALKYFLRSNSVLLFEKGKKNYLSHHIKIKLIGRRRGKEDSVLSKKSLNNQPQGGKKISYNMQSNNFSVPLKGPCLLFRLSHKCHHVEEFFINMHKRAINFELVLNFRKIMQCWRGLLLIEFYPYEATVRIEVLAALQLLMNFNILSISFTIGHADCGCYELWCNSI